ncbi:MAG: WD40 repeat domain-containing protein [Anaerolineaceae bacterium]|nr:WD40 repeat domain-containing protein [Anaerolineaceae bacterium]
MKRFLVELLFLGVFLAGFGSPLTAQSPDTDLFQETLRIGRGAVLHVEWNSTGTLILVDTVCGAWLYSFGGTSLSDFLYLEAARLARFNPARPLLAGVDDDNRVTFWDTTMFEQVASLPGHEARIQSLTWNPDGTQLATLDRAGKMIVWDADQLVKSLELRLEGADQIAWSPGGTRLAATDSDSGTIHVWNTVGELVFSAVPEYTGQFGSGITWRNETQFLQSFFDYYPSGILWDISTGEHTDFADIGYRNAYSPDGMKLVKTGIDVAGIRDADTLETLAYVSAKDQQPIVIAWSPDGQWIALGTGTVDINTHPWVIIADGTTGEIVNTFEHDYDIKEIQWSPDSQTFLTVDAANRIFVTDPTTSNPFISPASHGHADIGTAAAWRDDGEVIAAADTNYGARLWDAETGQLLVHLHSGQPVTRLAWQPGGTLLAATGGIWWQSKNNNVYIWDSSLAADVVDEGAVVIPHVYIPIAFAWSPDGQTLASIENTRYLRLWQPDMPGLIRVIDSYTIRQSPFFDYRGQFQSLAWSTNGDRLDTSFSSGGNGGGVVFVDIATATFVSGDTPSRHASAWVWTPDNRFIWANWGYFGDGAGIEPRPPIRDITLGGAGITSAGESLPPLTGLTGTAKKAVFSPDARLIIGFDDLGNGIVWDVQTRTPLAHLTAISDATWSPDSTMLVVYGLDGLIRVLDPQTGATLYTFNRHFYANAYNPANNIQAIWSLDSRKVAMLDNGVIFIYTMQG